ncbi:integrase family protein [Phocaeicola salanitronis DSM 18170]|uniref:Integrase family protein n=1 Tax=Phocaeicola salanitronis (strain DSM 18170 / JCM 13657 / CCUG 60908 / BL78) TaxID=667015 RepID=F0R6R4_PHOSB|nr:site-specific integrase [Phocaeicola salanitronis]ADY37969.1 integrase family protein [Phocaeicola salanitronis DSM 18170]
MATFKLKFRPSTAEGKPGTMYFQVTHRRSTRTVYTDYRVMPEEWDGRTSFIRITGTPERRAELQLIASKLRWDCKQITSLITEKELAMLEYTADDIVSAFRLLPPCQTWFGFIHGMTAKKLRVGRLGTAKTYRDALSSFSQFRDGEDMTVDALDAETMNQYEAWLKGRGVKRNSSSCYLRTLRTLYRKAVETGLTTDKHIFRHVFTGFAKTAKRAIPLSSLRAIRQLQLSEGSAIAFARDLFMLIVYLQGISFVDLAYLKKDDIRNGQLHYSRKKTGQELTVCWESVMQDIVDNYIHLTKGSPYLLPIITKTDGTERRQYERMEHKVNYYLKKIGTMVGLQASLTTYTGRHTWASILRDMGTSLSVISKGLGHESLKTTQIYLSSIDMEGVVKANRKMIGKIFRK